MYKVVEKFVSINGEGMKSGELAVFIRFQKCNLQCSYCDTLWATGTDAPYEEMTAEEIAAYIQDTGVKNVTLTGGEPLLQDNIEQVLDAIGKLGSVSVEIETNGSQSIEKVSQLDNRPSFTLDYKLPFSGMESEMRKENFAFIDKRDTLKFVCASEADLERARSLMETYCLAEKTNVLFSPVFGEIKPSDIVEYMVKHNMNGARIQLQLHKFIWNPEMRGV